MTPRSPRGALAAAAVLAVVHLAALGAGLLAPYSPLEQNRALPYAPPTPLHFVDREGHVHLRPFVGNPLARRIAARGEVRLEQRRPRRPGADAADADPLAAVVDRHRLRQLHDRSF